MLTGVAVALAGHQRLLEPTKDCRRRRRVSETGFFRSNERKDRRSEVGIELFAGAQRAVLVAHQRLEDRDGVALDHHSAKGGLKQADTKAPEV